MKIISGISLMLLMDAGSTLADLDRRTASDLYRESYARQMRQQMGASAAEIRADEYRIFYGEDKKKHRQSPNSRDGMYQNGNGADSFFHVPVMQ